MAGISLVLKELLRNPMVVLLTRRVEALSSGHFIFTVAVAPVQPSMSESGKSSKALGGAPLKVLIVKVGFAELSAAFSMPEMKGKNSIFVTKSYVYSE